MMNLPPKQKAMTSKGQLEFVTLGSGQPPIVLINGSGGPLEGWYKVLPGLAAMSTVFAYNRFGIGGSDKPNREQDGLSVIEDLKQLLDATGIRPPYILVGHSFGGLYVNLYARMYPQDVAGVVFIEASHPDDLAIQQFQGKFTRAINRLLELFSRRDDFKETNHAKETAAQIESAGPFPDVPLLVVSGGKTLPAWMVPPEARDIRAENQLAFVRLSPQGKQIVASRSGHFPQFSEPEIVVQAIKDCLDRASLT